MGRGNAAILLGMWSLLLSLSATWADEPAQAEARVGKVAKPLGAQRLHLTRKVIATPRVKIVFEGEPTPLVRDWANEAGSVVVEWWPQIARLLATDAFQPPSELALIFKRELSAPAVRTHEGIFISIPWITAHPDDFGMLVHELTHAIQDYPAAIRNAGWLVEGIADYVRYWHYEPELERPRLDPAKAHYRDGYGTSASFLAWLVARHDRRIVRTLDAALRAGQYQPELFQTITGVELDELWKQFQADRGLGGRS